MSFKQVTQSNKIVKRGRGRLRNPLSALAIAATAATAAAAAIPRTLTPEASPFLLNPFIKRLLMLTTVKALNNCTAAFIAANIAFENFLALDAAFLRSVANSPSGLANKTFALALAAFIALVALAAPVALVVVAPFALVIALAAFAAALAVVITLTKRRAKVKRLLRALVDLLL
ncbi:hypothetical protein MBM_05266 [Drepanopeziza brunnea f. sp. 'multigermtubi' MB_m1]|uniref:Uncharacterized protein n=1 Tax=Marssonina brunnea f. sp. multigermtubi (strain MB_m1) TaxID=1072389 RepID=K1WWD6_MARBU|nr:uncharacterized protein MBM_05266 [Drepanopeziza brunnea f. sp. 'multigermtubi' MB_m1]EKD16797.1 hypothetical protein MBM_05266 [Drepanopeziza brunnea f. sp. 'multigermtubi' MB_m1]